MKILVGHDGNHFSSERFEAACQQASAFDAEVHILASTPHSQEITPEKIAILEKGLDSIAKKFKENNIRCYTTLSPASLNPGENIIRHARDHAIDEIIISAKKRS